MQDKNLKRRAIDKDTGIMIIVNTWLFGVGAVLVIYKLILDSAQITSFTIANILSFCAGQIMELSTFAILLGGCFYSLVILRPDMAKRRREKQILDLKYTAAEKRAYVDAFTGLYNKEYFVRTLKTYLEESVVARSGVGMVMIEIENLRQFGMVEGRNLEDIILKEIGEALTKTAREYDVIARIGVKKFAILTPNIAASDLHSISSRFQKLIASIKINDAHPEIKFSIGFAIYEKQTPELFINSAEKHLKRIKRIAIEARPNLEIAA